MLHDEIWWLPFSEISGKQSVCTNIEQDALAEYCGATMATEVAPIIYVFKNSRKHGLK